MIAHDPGRGGGNDAEVTDTHGSCPGGRDAAAERTSMTEGTGTNSYCYIIRNRLPGSTQEAGNAVDYNFDAADS